MKRLVLNYFLDVGDDPSNIKKPALHRAKFNAGYTFNNLRGDTNEI